MAEIPIQFPERFITDRMCAANMALAASKHIRHQSIDVELFGPSTTVAAVTRVLHIVRGSQHVALGLEATICGAIATGADRTVTIDLQKSTGGGAFASILSSTIQFTDASTLRTAIAAVIDSANLIAGDILQLVVTVAGAAGDQATGLNITYTFTETFA